MKNSDIESILEDKRFEGLPDSKELVTEFTRLVEANYSEKTVLGIDIYRYSKMDIIPQTLIPYAFQRLYESTVGYCLKNETLFFNGKDRDWFENGYINTGDGCFQVFDDPLQALVFVINFQAHLRLLNSVSWMKLLSVLLVDGISVRYCITHDDVMTFNRNPYGPGIIKNARIISCDKLNRLLIDQNTYDWFIREVNGIETLQTLRSDDLKKYDPSKYPKAGASKAIISVKDSARGILRTDIQELESISVKQESLKVYNLHLQIAYEKTNDDGISKFVVSLGNLNTSGLNI